MLGDAAGSITTTPLGAPALGRAWTSNPFPLRKFTGGVQDPRDDDAHPVLQAPATATAPPTGSQKDISMPPATTNWGSVRNVNRRYQPSVASCSVRPSDRHGTTPLVWLQPAASRPALLSED